MNEADANPPATRQRRIPLWLKVVYTAYLCILAPIYAWYWGWANFLWFSNIALLTTAAALWLEYRLLPSMMTLAVLLPEVLWNVDFFLRLLSGAGGIGLADYMFRDDVPLFIRWLSLYHVVLPPLLVWLVYRLGYDRRALMAQTILAWMVLPISYLATTEERNVNWTMGLRGQAQEWMHPLLYLALLMLAFPLLVYVPTNFLMKWLFGQRDSDE